IDAETAADIEISEFVAELAKFCVIARGFAHCALDGGNVRNLRTDMKMNQLEAMSEAGLLQHLAGGDQIGGVESELRVLTAAGRPFPGTFAVQPNTNADDRLDADFFRGFDRLFEFFEFFNNDHNKLAEFATEKRNPNER